MKIEEFNTCDLVRELERRKEAILIFRKDDIKTCCDQTKGLLTDKCVDDILAKYDVEGDLLTATTEAMEDILHDYEKSGNRLEYDW